MSRVMIFLIKIYQSLPLSIHKNCKYIPRCSDYSKEAYERYGFFYGTHLTIKIILNVPEQINNYQYKAKTFTGYQRKQTFRLKRRLKC